MAKGWDLFIGSQRHTVTSKKTLNRETGKYESDLALSQQRGLKYAMSDLDEYGEIEPLLLQVRQGNPYVMSNPDAREMVLKALSGKGFKGGSRNKKQLKGYEKTIAIYQAVEYLNTYRGMQVFNRVAADHTACGLVAKYAGKTASHIYKLYGEVKLDELIKQQEREDMAAQDPMYHGLHEYICPLRCADKVGNPPAPDEVVIYFLTGEFREEGRQEALDKQLQDTLQKRANRIAAENKQGCKPTEKGLQVE